MRNALSMDCFETEQVVRAARYMSAYIVEGVVKLHRTQDVVVDHPDIVEAGHADVQHA